MAYHRKNHLQKRAHAMRVTREYYEPGRQDRCYRWVWSKYIRDQFHVEYDTYLRWLRAERAREADKDQLTLF